MNTTLSVPKESLRSDGKRMCGATKRRTGEPCRALAMPNGRCRIHGGATPSGIAANNFQHGARSKYLPVRMQERALEAMNDPDLLGLRQELGALDARLTELYARADVGAGRDQWIRAKQAVRAFIVERDRRPQNQVAFRQAWADVEVSILEGASDFDTWLEIRDVIQERRKVVESERRRMVEMNQMMPAEEVVNWGTALMLSVRNHVRDPETLRKINDDFQRLTRRPGPI